MADTTLSDEHAEHKTLSHETIWDGTIFSLAQDEIQLPGNTNPTTRQYVTHPGAAAVIVTRANGNDTEILTQKQYRHPVGMYLWEIPAGCLDAGESALDCAKRELAEEAGLECDGWEQLVSYFSSPGMSNEQVTIFLARDPKPVETNFQRNEEEANITHKWVKLDDMVNAVLAGRIHNPSACMGVLSLNARMN